MKDAIERTTAETKVESRSNGRKVSAHTSERYRLLRQMTLT